MEWVIDEEEPLSFSVLKVRGTFLGEDLLLTVTGGEKPHVGCTVLSVPRPSLAGDGTVGATSSVINLTGHKDEFLCRKIAEAVCKKKNVTVVCTGGFHVDNITKEQIAEVMAAAEKIGKRIGK